MTRFSVLIPTRNRLEYLEQAVYSVLMQEETDVEIIISDNHSEQDVRAYVDRLGDGRVKYVRPDTLLCVTDNWNYALEKSSGDYVVMLGDDDALMPGYFTCMRTIIEDFPSGDLIFTNAFLFAYPNTLPGHPQGLAKLFGAAGFFDRPAPYRLDPKQAESLVEQTLNFTCAFAFNMQFALIRRDLITRLMYNNAFFHSPYPDYYAMTILMMCSLSTLICPYPMVAVGISPKSFGYYYFNGRESEGVSFLGHTTRSHDGLEHLILPGTDMNTSWLCAMKTVQAHFPDRCPPVNVSRYRRLQILAVYRQCLGKKPLLGRTFRELWNRLTVRERVIFGLPLLALRWCPLRVRLRVVRYFEDYLSPYLQHLAPPVEGTFPTMRHFIDYRAACSKLA